MTRPGAEMERIASAAQRALATARLVTDVRPGLREGVVFSACPIDLQPSQPRVLTAWTLTRVPLIGYNVVNPLILAVSLLLCMVVVSGLWLGRMLARWREQAMHLQQQLAQSERLATLGRMSAGLRSSSMGAEGPRSVGGHSHSIVAGGLLLTS